MLCYDYKHKGSHMGNKKQKIYYASIVTFLLFFVCAGFSSTSASSVVDEFSVTVPESCSLTGTVGVAHSTTIENGVYSDDVGETTINAFCNDAEGFSIYAVGYTNGEFSNNTMKPSALDDANAIITGLATSGDTSNWAMKLTSMSENFTLTNGFGSYHLVPDEYTKVATYPSNTTTTAGVNIKSTYAAYISQTQPADTYTGKVKYIVLHPSSKQPTTNISDLTTMQDFKDLSSDEKVSVAMSMHDRTTYELIDTRDNKTYQIAKMKDGNIWMAENLDLGRTTLTTDLTSENSNLAETVTAETFNGWKVTRGSSSYTKGEFILNSGSDPISGTSYGILYNYYAMTGGTSTTSTSYYSGYDICPSGWRLPTYTNDYEFLINSYNSDSSSLLNSVLNDGAAFARAGDFEVYYPTQMGSSGYYWTTDYVNGYRTFFISERSNSYSNRRKYAGASVRCLVKKPEYSFTIAYGDGVSSVTLDGENVTDGEVIIGEKDKEFKIGMIPEEYYSFDSWSATGGVVESPDYQYTTYVVGQLEGAILSVSATRVNIEIQNMSSSSCSSTPIKAYDNRDGHVYTVQRLLDGNCWIMENLDLGRTDLAVDLTSQNTNLSNTVSATTFNSWKKESGSDTLVNGEFIPIAGGDDVAGTGFGTLYNYYATTAGTVAGSSVDFNAEYDICPAGWRLPIGGPYGELESIENKYDNTQRRNSIKNGGAAFAYAGVFNNGMYNGIPYDQNYSINNWSSTRYDNTVVRTTWADNRRGRATGGSIRCLMKRPTQTVSISYGEGVSSVLLDEKVIENSASFIGEQGTTYPIDMLSSPKYTFNSWSATAGTIIESDVKSTYYTIGTSNATLSVSTTYVDTEMQNLGSASCTSTPLKVYDNRDGFVYTVQRLLDGNCWMISNLELGKNTLITDLTSQNTNLANTITSETFNSWKTNNDGPHSYDQGGFITTNGVDAVNKMPRGTLYNYCVASAGTICVNDYPNGSDAEYDICPAGWRLPTGGNSGEFKTLYGYYNSVDLMRASTSNGGAAFVFAGRFTYQDLTALNSTGYYWSSTYDNSSCMKVLRIETYYVNSTDYWNRYYGQSIRCILK